MATALIKALCNEAQGAAKGMPKHAPEAFQNPARHVPKPSKIEARSALGRRNAPKRRQKSAKRRPRGSKTRPRAPKKCPRGPKRRPRASRSWPRAAQDGPRPLQNRARSAPGPHLHALLTETLVQEAAGPCFSSFFLSLAGCPTCSDVCFVPLLPVFCRVRSIHATEAREHAKAIKNLVK